MTAPVRGFVSDQDIDRVTNAVAETVLTELSAQRGRIRRVLADIRRNPDGYVGHLDEVDG